MASVIFNATAADDRPQRNALLTLEVTVDDEWIDYNGHMTEWQYYKVLADAGENFLRAMGFTEEYRLQGFSFFSVEGHLRNLKECRTGAPLRVFTEIIGFDELRLHIYQYVVDQRKDVVLATGEHMMVHVDTNRRGAVPMGGYMTQCLTRAMEAWKPEEAPKGLASSVKGIRA